MSGESGSNLARQARQLIRNKRYREAFQLAAQARDLDPRCAQVNSNNHKRIHLKSFLDLFSPGSDHLYVYKVKLDVLNITEIAIAEF